MINIWMLLRQVLLLWHLLAIRAATKALNTKRSLKMTRQASKLCASTAQAPATRPSLTLSAATLRLPAAAAAAAAAAAVAAAAAALLSMLVAAFAAAAAAAVRAAAAAAAPPAAAEACPVLLPAASAASAFSLFMLSIRVTP
jgi:hypothetical protein